MLHANSLWSHLLTYLNMILLFPVGSLWAFVPMCDLAEVKELNNSFEISGNYCILKGKNMVQGTQIFVVGVN